jgi:hypothetical protein
MTNVMHNFLICVSIYFCLTRFEFSFNPSLEAGLQLRQLFKSSEYGVSARALTPYLNHYQSFTPASKDGLNETPKHVR